MSKALESLEALKFLVDNYSNIEFDFSIIEAALKENERLKTSYLENLLNEESKEYIYKKFEALEIIRYRFSIQFSKSDLPNYYGIMQIGNNPIYIKTQEEFDLLKEVLL